MLWRYIFEIPVTDPSIWSDKNRIPFILHEMIKLRILWERSVLLSYNAYWLRESRRRRLQFELVFDFQMNQLYIQLSHINCVLGA